MNCASTLNDPDRSVHVRVLPGSGLGFEDFPSLRLDLFSRRIVSSEVRLLPLSGSFIPGPTSTPLMNGGLSLKSASEVLLFCLLAASFASRSSSNLFCSTVERPALIPERLAASAGIEPVNST